MSDIVDFETTANQDELPMPDETVPTPPPEELQEMQEQGGEQMLQLIQRNRKISHESLQRAFEGLEATIDQIVANRDLGPILVTKDGHGRVVFSLEDSLRTIMKGLGACLTSMEANNSLMDMLIHDFGGLVHNTNQTQRSMLMANSHVQTLLELLMEKGVITEPEMKATWDRLIQEKRAQFEQAISEK